MAKQVPAVIQLFKKILGGKSGVISVAYWGLSFLCFSWARSPLAHLGGGIEMKWGPVCTLLLRWGGVVNLLVGALYASPESLRDRFSCWLKNKNGGNIHVLPGILCLPFLLETYAVWVVKHFLLLRGVEEYCSRVHESFYLGRWPGQSVPTDVTVVVDITCEFPKGLQNFDEDQYICLPCLDKTMPPVADVERAVLQVLRLIENGKRSGAKPVVYVHCANGHGRSAIFIAACLMLLGEVQSPIDALQMFQKSRPAAGWNKEQEKVGLEIVEKVRKLK